MKAIFKRIKMFFREKSLVRKIEKLEKEIEEVRELTKNNYWKLQKQLPKKNKK